MNLPVKRAFIKFMNIGHKTSLGTTFDEKLADVAIVKCRWRELGIKGRPAQLTDGIKILTHFSGKRDLTYAMHVHQADHVSHHSQLSIHID